jgi:hypothetical protein
VFGNRKIASNPLSWRGANYCCIACECKWRAVPDCWVLLESTAAIQQDKHKPIQQKVLKVQMLIRPGAITCRNLFKVLKDDAKVPQMCPTPFVLPLIAYCSRLWNLNIDSNSSPVCTVHPRSPAHQPVVSMAVVHTIAASYVNFNRELSRIVGCCWSPQQPLIRTNVSQYDKKC